MPSRPPALRQGSPSMAISQLSPHILTPDEAMHSHSINTFSFPKQPLPPVRVMDDTAWSYEGIYHMDAAGRQESLPTDRHKSLLTTLLHSPDHQMHVKRYPTPPSIISSARSSTPSTAISSPNGPAHGILHKDPSSASILRRGSISASSDGGNDNHPFGLGLGFGGSALDGLVGRMERVEEKGETIGWADEVVRTEVIFYT